MLACGSAVDVDGIGDEVVGEVGGSEVRGGVSTDTTGSTAGGGGQVACGESDSGGGVTLTSPPLLLLFPTLNLQ